MTSFFLKNIVIERCSAGGCPLKEGSEHCLLSTHVLFWCCGFVYCVVSLLFYAIFMFSTIIIYLVAYKKTLNLKGMFIFYNLFQRLVLGTMSSSFLNSKKHHKRLVLLLQHSS
jgi:hypothetical protein